MLLTPNNYLHHYLRREVNELYWSASIRKVATSLLAIFAAIYLYNLGFDIRQIALWHAVVYISHAFFVFLSAKVINHTGYELCMAISIPLGVAIYLCYLIIPAYLWLFYPLAILWGIYKAFYWIPYHSDFARFGDHKNIGKEIGFLVVIIALIEAIAPLVSGYIIDWRGIEILFIIASVIMAFSATPMLKTREKLLFSPFKFKIFWKKTVGKWRKDILPLMGFGEELIGQAVWPIFIFITVGSYKAVGIITTLVIFVSLATFLWVGKLSDKGSKGRLVRRTSWPVLFAWIGRILAINWFAVLFFDSLFNISKRSLGVPLTGIFYNRPKDDEEIIYYIVFREVTLAIGKIIAALLLVILFTFTDKLYLAFILAGFFSLFYMLWHEKMEDYS